ncbi:MAG: nucleoside 2-deoxyribosyltransferase [Candidatus Aenigmarchaeota archaeon]|nr:nucleoside 2-deoxyribosyltransferase [Candidatus Aenigmarchaeota archaeon]
MRIYFAYTIRGDKSQIHIAREIANMLKEKGHHIMTEIFLSDNAEDKENHLTPQEIFDRDVKWLHECDVIVSEVSGSSFGIGYELGYVLGSTNKKAFILYHKNAEHKISRMAIGNTQKNCTVFAYSDLNDLKNFIDKHF